MALSRCSVCLALQPQVEVPVDLQSLPSLSSQASSAALSPPSVVIVLALAENIVVAVSSALTEFVGAVVPQGAWNHPAPPPARLTMVVPDHLYSNAASHYFCWCFVGQPGGSPRPPTPYWGTSFVCP
ncbi:uncharacterized protein CIMG_12920 [Coccidioides immitis RS]|uniref:Uncharacterized protein n=1 Tax=Coccidioides immitis (strain RS) TaxID=246410 RepID=A0A0D8JSX9_COCIM|nr:uncharacterized protein CIMG_12920 [Coccidioides immitis RS]KJF60392.1 hypothetical protein CIMG_12920 [Coccidioides immitis RS]